MPYVLDEQIFVMNSLLCLIPLEVLKRQKKGFW